MERWVNIFFIMEEWDIDAGKHLIKEMVDKSKNWCDWVIVQKPICLIPNILFRFREKILKMAKGKYRSKKLNENSVLFTPIIVFHFALWLSYKIIASVDTFLLSFQINYFIKKLYKKHKIALWVYTPKFFPLLKKINFDYLIYYIQDNMAYSADDGNRIEPDYIYNDHLIKKSDLVVCTAELIYNYSKSLNENIIYLPNGNNYKTLSNLRSFKKTELDNLDKPIIGYLGGIRNWIDFDLIKFVLGRFTNSVLVFLGPVYNTGEKGLRKLLKYQNFKWINFKDQHELPSYLNKFSVGIIPFRINKFMDAVFPNKFYEYMAVKIPIVSTALPELKKYSSLIGYSENYSEFADNCLRAINGDFDYAVKFYPEIARNNSWEIRAEKLNNILMMQLNIQT